MTATRIDRLSISGWDSLILESLRYDVAPLLYSRVKKFNGTVTIIPDAILQKLQKIHFSSAVKNVLLYDGLSEVCSALASEDIEVAILKGAHLAGIVYDDVALRPMTDLDILVKQKDLFKVERILLRMGYGPSGRPGIEEQCAKHHHLIPFTKQGKPPIEVHWTICPVGSPFRIDMNDIWGRAKKTTLAGATVFLLSPEDLLMHMCLHISFNHKFNCFTIKNMCDISEIITRYGNDIDWERLVSIAGNSGITRYIYVALSLTETLLGVEMPSGIRCGLHHEDADTQIVGVLQNYILRRHSLLEILMMGCTLMARATFRTETTRRLLRKKGRGSVIEKWLAS
jgi:hypothetical protein